MARGQPDGLADVGESAVQVALEGGQLAAGAERPGAFPCRLREQPGHPAEPLPALVELAGDLPVAGQPHGEVRAEPQPGGGVGRRRRGPRARLLLAERVAERRADVLPLPVQRAQRPRLIDRRPSSGVPPRARPPSRNRPSKSLALASDRAVSRSRNRSAPPASASRSAPNSRSAPSSRYLDGSAPSLQHHGLVDEADQRVDDLLARQGAVRAHVLGAAHVERPREHRQPLPQRPLGRRAQPVAPLHRGAQGLVPRAGAAAADRQRPDAGLQLACQLRQRQRAQPHGGELDRERDAVEPPAQPHDVRPVRAA